MAVDFSGENSSLPSDLIAGNDFLFDDQNSSSSESAFNGFGSCGSSDRGTSVGSELGSTETESDDDGFMADLTRQMADYMLDDKEEDGEISKSDGVGPYIKPTAFLSHHHTHLWNQQNLKNSGYFSGGRREKTELSQRFRPNQQLNPIRLSQPAESGMRAVFLGPPGSRSTCSGTGVFLPRGNAVALQPAGKKTRCSTVLIPARVLQALELHFSNVDTTHAGAGAGAGAGPTFINYKHDVIVGGDVYHQKRQLDSQTRPTINYDKEIQLPPEWTY